MNTCQVRPGLPKLHHSTFAQAVDHAEDLGPYQLQPGASVPPAHPGYALDRWLARFNSPWKMKALRESPSAFRLASKGDASDQLLPDATSQADSRRVPPPKSPSNAKATEAEDDGWEPTVLDFYVGANQLVVRCRVCTYTGALRDLHVDLVPLSS